jgi:hypothetical protein
MSDTVSRPRKKSKTMKKSVEQEKVTMKKSVEQEKMPQDNEELDIPETPIKVMQQVGTALGIDPDQLTEEKLNAPLSSKKPKNVSNDK